MKRSKVPLRSMPNIVDNCIILHNLCILKQQRYIDEWIVERENKLPRRSIKGEIQEGCELRGEKTRLAEVKIMIWTKENALIADEVNNAEKYLFFIEMTYEDKWSSTWSHSDELFTKNLWQYKIQKKSSRMENK